MMRTVKVILIPSEPRDSLSIADLENPGYQTFHQLVGELMELISLRHGALLAGNDQAKVLGLPVNDRGTCLLWMRRPEFIGAD